MERLAEVRIVMWEGASLWVIDATPEGTRERKQTDFHAHHAIQVTLSLGGRFGLATADTPMMRGDAVAVAADTSHTFEAEGLIAMVFVEPESRLGRSVARNLFAQGELAAVASERLGNFRSAIAAAYRAHKRDDRALAELGRALVASLAGDTKADVPDLRVRKMIAWVAGKLDGPVSLADAVALGDLSAGRLRHLFVEQTGLPFRTYLLWLRLMRALERYALGGSLTEAAHEAGFADQAHLSRTFRRMFGVAPANLKMA